MVEEFKVKDGYKKSEVGIIPEDWKCMELGNLFSSVQLGGNYKNSEEETLYPLIKMGNLDRGKIKLNKIEYIDNKTIPSNRDELKYGDVLFNTRNTLELVGKTSIWRDELCPAYFNSNILRLNFKESYVNSTFFMNYILNTTQSIGQLRNFATGTTSVAAIYTRDLVKLKIVVPSLQEQELIAKTLEDTGNLIISLEKIIDKKKKIKQGTMQQLLTGKKRLPGFSGEWENKKLGEIADIINGGTPSTTNPEYWDGDIKWCTPTDITKSDNKYLCYTKRNITEVGLVNSSATLLPKGTLLFCSRATIGEVRITTNKITTNQGFKSFIVFSEIFNEWLYYWMVNNKSIFLEKAFGSTFLEISKKNIASIELMVPLYEEQESIAQILSDMDVEIELLEQKLNKYKNIKQGMMQELLTGRIRVI